MRRKPSRLVILIIFIISFIYTSFGQSILKPVRVAVLAPLYIDSAFAGGDYKNIPRYMLPGLEFYNGVMMAVDSMQQENMPVEVWVYDTKQKGVNTASIEQELTTNNISLIVASLSNAVEQQSLSTFAFNSNIPLVSVTYPNDAGVSSNPFFIILNSTIKTHVQGVYKYVKQNFAGGKIYYVTRKGAMEDKIKADFDDMRGQAPAVKYTWIELADNFDAYALLPLLDSTGQNVIVCGSLDENFGLNVVHTLSSAPASYHFTVVGMPTWDGIKALRSDGCKNVNIIFSTPYNYSNDDYVVERMAQLYQEKFNAYPTDMVLKGFEAMYHFTHLLVAHTSEFAGSLQDPSFKIANDFNIQPVRLKASSYVPDYLENKKLYFVKLLNGNVVSVN